jgi:diadenosine tetraphosphate (Ap4A) HIT family hydrolase
VIPKHHGAKLTDIPDDSLAELLPVAKKIAAASGVADFNILQNNGRIAHQIVDHVHGMFLGQYCMYSVSRLHSAYDPEAERAGRLGHQLAATEW